MSTPDDRRTGKGAPAHALDRRKSCFVVMPYGDSRRHPHTGQTIDFDSLYTRFIKPSVEAAGLRCERADRVEHAGVVQKDMIERLLSADLVIVDITTGNPNVCYELGVRHTARKSATIIIRLAGDRIPFNINFLRAIEYENPADTTALEAGRKALASVITANMAETKIDSPVHTLIPGLNVTRRATPVPARQTFTWTHTDLPGRRFSIDTGDLMFINDIDIWVNPENTKMQMGRFHDDSVSASIRYFGANRDQSGAVRRDLVRDALRWQIRRHKTVEAGTVVATTAGALTFSNAVKAVLHVAAQHGEPGKGYITVRSFADCISNCLEAADTLNARWRVRVFGGALRSIIFPLFGTRGADRDPQAVADRLVVAAREHFKRTPKSRIERISFLAYTDRDSELSEAAFRHAGFDYVSTHP